MTDSWIIESNNSMFGDHWVKIVECDNFDTCNVFLSDICRRIIDDHCSSSIDIHVSKDRTTWTIASDDRMAVYRISPSFEEICDNIIKKTKELDPENNDELKTYLKDLAVDMQKSSPKNFNKFCNMIVKNLNLVKDSEESDDSDE